MKPDWKDENSYKYTGSLKPAGWAWEFARRNPQYRKAFKKYQKTVEALKDELGPDWQASEKAKRPDPPKMEGESEQKWTIRADEEGKRASYISLDQAMGLPFHLNGMFDPDKFEAEDIEFLPVSKLPKILTDPAQIDEYVKDIPIHEEDGIYHDDSMFDPEYAVIVFDLSVSAEKQVPKVSMLLNEARKKRGLKKPQAPTVKLKPWIRYLRVLDAKMSAVSDDEIASVLWPKPEPDDDTISSLENAYKTARRWRQPNRYIRLLQMKA